VFFNSTEFLVFFVVVFCAYWALPSKPGVTGLHGYCIDETGMVRVYVPGTAWAAPSADRPRCPETSRSPQQVP